MKRTLSAMAIIALAVPAMAQTDISPTYEEVAEPQKIYSPYVERTATDKNFSEGLYWGDTHLHTRYSTDSGMIGNKLGPEDAYRFALGEEVRTSSGQRARLIRPLDFLVVSDHAENLGLAPMIAESNPELLRSPWAKELHDMVSGTADMVLADVRAPLEFADNHIEGAVNIPAPDLRTRYKELDPDKTVVVLCSSGNRSSLAASILKQHGFRDVRNVAGGMTGYSAAGHARECPVCTTPHGSRYVEK